MKDDLYATVTNRILLSMSALATGVFIAQGILSFFGLLSASIHFTLLLGILAIIHWVFYMFHRIHTIPQPYALHITAFSCLILLSFTVLFNPFDFQEQWVVLLFFPIIISLFQNKKVFMLWSTLSILICGGYIFVQLQAITPLNNSEELYLFLLTRCSIILGSLVLAWNITHLLTQIKEVHHKQNEERNRQYMIRLLHTLIPIVERKSQTTSSEIERMTILVKRMMNLFPNEKVQDWEIQLLSLLHYVSRIKWPDYVFEKESKLTNFEYQMVQEHCYIGGDFLEDTPAFQRVIETLSYHHERFDGTGYPHQLKGDKIPKLAQVLGIVESFMAMTSSRSYRNALCPEEAFEEIKSMQGAAYDITVVEALQYALKLKDHPSVEGKSPYKVG